MMYPLPLNGYYPPVTVYDLRGKIEVKKKTKRKYIARTFVQYWHHKHKKPYVKCWWSGKVGRVHPWSNCEL